MGRKSKKYVSKQWSSDLRENKVISLYKEIKPDFEYEHYLDLIRLKSDRKVIVQIRLSAHDLHIQTGRYGTGRVEKNQRLCNICNNGDIEDEFHFIITCIVFKVIRKIYVSNHFIDRPSVQILCELLCSTDKSTINKMMSYIKCALVIRRNHLYT